MDLQLTGKVAIVTGGSRGLGFAIGRSLLAEGCHLAVCARGAERLEQAATELRSAAAQAAQVLPITADVSKPDDVVRVVETAATRFGGVDILVNNVGLARGGSLEETTDEAWQEAFDQTLYPAIRASRAAVPHLRRRGGGAVIIISSIFGREAG